METLIENIPALIESIGVFQTVFVILTLVFAIAMVKGQLFRGDTPKKPTPKAVPTLPCAWIEMDRHILHEMNRTVEDVRDRVVRIEDRTKR